MTASDTETPRGAPSKQLVNALFDFEAAPGRYPLALREPRLLFDNCRAVLVAAARRGMDDLSQIEVDGIQRAAVFFVRTAMFRSAADHYTLLGLQPGCNSKQLSDHYRLLMRLIHPDFASAGNAWPREAAARINQAHDILASPTQRAEYDQSLSHGLKNHLGINSQAAVLSRSGQAKGGRAPPKWPLAVAGAAGVLVLSLLLLQTPMGANADGDSPLSLVVPPPAAPAAKPSSALATLVVPGPLPMKFETLLATVLPTLKKQLPVLPSAHPTAGLDPLAVKSPKPDRAASIMAMSDAPRNAAAKFMQADLAVQPGQPLPSTSLQPPSAFAPAPAATAPAMAAVAPATVASVQTASQKADILPPAAPSLAEAQQVMSQLIQAMQSGRGENLLIGLDRPLRQSSGAADLVLAYNHLVGGSRSIRLGAVQLRGSPQADRLVIDGVVPLVLQDQGQPAPVRELRLRAMFVQRGGQVVMTELSSGGSRP